MAGMLTMPVSMLCRIVMEVTDWTEEAAITYVKDTIQGLLDAQEGSTKGVVSHSMTELAGVPCVAHTAAKAVLTGIGARMRTETAARVTAEFKASQT